MILSIDSTISTFKRLNFHEGLNVLLADAHAEASGGHTRNSAGKTSLIEIIHFLLGADCDKSSMFRSEALVNHSFQGTFLFDGELVLVERSGSQPARIYIVEGSLMRSKRQIKQDKESGRRYLSNENWKAFLGSLMFRLPSEPMGTVFEQPFTPSFRSMISYFVRRESAGGFLSPERQAEKQQAWDWQENVSYLLGLDWQIPFEFQKIKAREKALTELKKAAKGGALGDVIGTVAELRPKVTVAERKAMQRREQLQNFQVLPSYKELAKRAADAKTSMQAISRENVVLMETLSHLNEALNSEEPLHSSRLEEMYAAVGVELPGVARRRLDEVHAFYESIAQNRTLHLQSEISEADRRIQENEAKALTLDVDRQETLKTLESKGALEDFTALQRELADLEAQAAALRERYKAASALEGENTQLEIDRNNLHRRLQQDFHEKVGRMDRAILLVADTISELYDDRSGTFEIRATDRGPRFKISIEGDRGGGIASMEIFCFDLALFQIVSNNFQGPGFLIHDSHLFDGVDERQIARALFLGHRATSGRNLQYIVTMNSDIFDRLPLPKDVNREAIVLSTRLSDETATGGLFGFRFS